MKDCTRDGTVVSTPANRPTTPAADWVIALDPSQPAGALAPALLGQYDLSGALFHYDQQTQLPPLMKAAGMTEWRVGVGRWEFGTQLLPTLTDGTSCLPLPPYAQAPPNTTDLDLIRARDWFTYTDGTPVNLAMTGDDSRYMLGYVRSVLDVAAAFGAEPYLDIDHMPRALAANQTPSRTNAMQMNACGISWTNNVSNQRPADPTVFAAAVVGLVKRVVEGSDGQPGRPVRYWEFWNEPDGGYAWAPTQTGDFNSYLVTASTVLTALDAYRKQTANADGKAIRIGFGSFANPDIAAKVLPLIDAPFDFISFHSEGHDDPLLTVADIETVAAARQASASHQGVELALSEWTQSLSNSTLDPNTMDVALHHATVIALGAAAGLAHTHHAIFWDFYGQGVPGLGILNHDFSPKPAYYAYTLLAKVIGKGSSRLAPTGNADGKLDGGLGAVLASKDAGGRVRVLLVNRNAGARTARIDLPTGAAKPTSVRAFADPKTPPAAGARSTVIAVPARSIVLVKLRPRRRLSPPRCGGAFEKSCVRRLYRCFDATGTCARDISRFFSEGVVTDCWQNGAHITLSGFHGTGTAVLTNSRGKACLMGNTAGHPDTSIEITYVRRHKRHYLIARAPNGAFTVTCPNGKVENYSPEDVKAAGCGPIADCPFGACP